MLCVRPMLCVTSPFQGVLPPNGPLSGIVSHEKMLWRGNLVLQLVESGFPCRVYGECAHVGEWELWVYLCLTVCHPPASAATAGVTPRS